MNQRELILYIAVSLDGYIATENGDIGWLSAVESPGEDYGYSDFNRTVDTVIMGRKTYDKVLGFDIPFPHQGRACYVLSASRQGSDEHVTFFNGDVKELLAKIREEEGKHIFCDGGADVACQLMEAGLIDRYIISVIPVLLGAGVRLFKDGRPGEKLKLSRCTSFPAGLVQLWYEKA